MEDFADPDPVLVGRRLEALREAVGIRERKAFAHSIGLDNSSYTKIVAGNKPLQSVYAHRAAKRYGVTMDYFFDGSFAKMDETMRREIIKYLGGQNR